MRKFTDHLILLEAKVDDYVSQWMKHHAAHPLVRQAPEQARMLIRHSHPFQQSKDEAQFVTSQLLNGTYLPEEDDDTIKDVLGRWRKGKAKGFFGKRNLSDFESHDHVIDHFDQFPELKTTKQQAALRGMDQYKIGEFDHPEHGRMGVYHIHHGDMQKQFEDPEASVNDRENNEKITAEYKRLSGVIRKSCKGSNWCVISPQRGDNFLQRYSKGHGFFLYTKDGVPSHAHGYQDRGLVDLQNRVIGGKEKDSFFEGTQSLLPDGKKQLHKAFAMGKELDSEEIEKVHAQAFPKDDSVSSFSSPNDHQADVGNLILSSSHAPEHYVREMIQRFEGSPNPVWDKAILHQNAPTDVVNNYAKNGNRYQKQVAFISPKIDPNIIVDRLKSHLDFIRKSGNLTRRDLPSDRDTLERIENGNAQMEQILKNPNAANNAFDILHDHITTHFTPENEKIYRTDRIQDHANHHVVGLLRTVLSHPHLSQDRLSKALSLSHIHMTGVPLNQHEANAFGYGGMSEEEIHKKYKSSNSLLSPGNARIIMRSVAEHPNLDENERQRLLTHFDGGVRIAALRNPNAVQDDFTKAANTTNLTRGRNGRPLEHLSPEIKDLGFHTPDEEFRFTQNRPRYVSQDPYIIRHELPGTDPAFNEMPRRQGTTFHIPHGVRINAVHARWTDHGFTDTIYNPNNVRTRSGEITPGESTETYVKRTHRWLDDQQSFLDSIDSRKSVHKERVNPGDPRIQARKFLIPRERPITVQDPEHENIPNIMQRLSGESTRESVQNNFVGFGEFLTEAKVDEFVNRYMKGWEDHPLVKENPQEARRRIAGAHGIGNTHHQNIFLTGELLNGVYRPEEDAPVMRQMVGLHSKAVKFGHAKKEDISHHTHDSLTSFFDDLEQKDERFDDAEPPKPGNPKLSDMDKYFIGSIKPHPKSERKRIDLNDPIHVYHVHHQDVSGPREYRQISKVIGKNCPRNSNICVRDNPTYLETYSRGHGFLMYVQGGRILRAHGYGDRGIVDHKNGLISEKNPVEHEHLVSETLKLLKPERRLTYGIHMANRPVVVDSKETGVGTYNPTQEDKKQRINQALGNMGPLEIINFYKKEAKQHKRDLQKRKTKDIYYPVNYRGAAAAERYSAKKSDVLTDINVLIHRHLLDRGESLSGTPLGDPRVIKHIAMNQVHGNTPDSFSGYGASTRDPLLEPRYVSSDYFDGKDLSKIIKRNKDSIRKMSETKFGDRVAIRRLKSDDQPLVSRGMGTRIHRVLADPGETRVAGFYHNRLAEHGKDGLETLRIGTIMANRRGFLTQKHVDDIFDLGDHALQTQKALLSQKNEMLRPKHIDSLFSNMIKNQWYFDYNSDVADTASTFFEHPLHTREHIDAIKKLHAASTKTFMEDPTTKNENRFNKNNGLLLATLKGRSPHITHEEISNYINHPDRSISSSTELAPTAEGPVNKGLVYSREPDMIAQVHGRRKRLAEMFANAAIAHPNATGEHITQYLMHPNTKKAAIGKLKSDVLQKFTPEHEHMALDIIEGKRNHDPRIDPVGTSPVGEHSTGNHSFSLYHNLRDPSALHRVIHGNTRMELFHDMLHHNPHLQDEHLDAMQKVTEDFLLNKKPDSSHYDFDSPSNILQSIGVRRQVGKPLAIANDEEADYLQSRFPSREETHNVLVAPPRPRVGEKGTPEYKMRKPRRFDEGFLSFNKFIIEQEFNESQTIDFVNRYMKFYKNHPVVLENPQHAKSLIEDAFGIGETHEENTDIIEGLFNGDYVIEE